MCDLINYWSDVMRAEQKKYMILGVFGVHQCILEMFFDWLGHVVDKKNYNDNTQTTPGCVKTVHEYLQLYYLDVVFITNYCGPDHGQAH